MDSGAKNKAVKIPVLEVQKRSVCNVWKKKVEKKKCSHFFPMRPNALAKPTTPGSPKKNSWKGGSTLGSSVYLSEVFLLKLRQKVFVMSFIVDRQGITESESKFR